MTAHANNANNAATLQCWFDFASTYSYLTVQRIEPLAAAAGVTVDWRPFLLGPAFTAMGWNDSPFNIYPTKGRYMWRDMERLCAKYDLPLRRPSQFPRNGLLPARVALAFHGASWEGEFIRRVFSASFADDRDIGQREVIAEILGSMALDAPAILEAADAQENKDALRRQTQAAVDLGIFGAPTLIANGELFWGNDRLEDALAWFSAPAG